jgi:tRNA U34 2-thiouridine synthase MnmA/TrmU
MNRIRAVGLISGGLDSALAAKLLLEQGIEVLGLHLQSPTACRNPADEVAAELGIPLEVRAKGEEYLRLLRHPRFGYGKNMNPCIDCRSFMFRLGRGYLDEVGARFLFTGEVVGQRPMSQMREAIRLIDRDSDLEGWVVRPLSAQLLPESEPEKRGWVDRSRLLGIMGRGRHDQMALAEHYGLKSFQSPGGGCLLTDAIFSRKLRDLFDHVAEEDTREADVELLRVGRHFRVDAGLKIVLGRSLEENERLPSFANAARWMVEPDDFNGPSALVCGPKDPRALDHAIELIAHYTRDAAPERTVRWSHGAMTGTRALGDRLVTVEPPPLAL